MRRLRIHVSLVLAALALILAAALAWRSGAGGADAPPGTIEADVHRPARVSVRAAQHIEVVFGEALLDDGDRTNDGSSLADVVQGWLESPAFAAVVDEHLRRELSTTEHCQRRLRRWCLVSSRRQITGARLLGPSSVRFEIVGDLVVAEVRLRELTIDVEGGITTAGVPIPLRGHLEVRTVVFRTSLALSIADDQLAVDIHGSDVQIGRIQAQLRGWRGQIAESLIGRYESDIREMAEAALTRHVSAAVSNALAEAVGSLRLAPRKIVLGGKVNVKIRLTAVRVRPEGIRAALLVQVEGEPLRPASVRATTQATGQAWASVDLGMLDRCLTALWRQGGLATTIPGTQSPGGSVSADMRATVSEQPRLRAGEGGRLAVVLPGIELRAVLPRLGAGIVVGRAEATISAAPRLKGGALVLVAPRVDALEFSGLVSSTVLAMSPNATKASIEDLATEALTSILPAIPVPSIELPAWLQEHGPSGIAATEGTVWVEASRIGITIPQIVVR